MKTCLTCHQPLPESEPERRLPRGHEGACTSCQSVIFCTRLACDWDAMLPHLCTQCERDESEAQAEHFA